MRAVFTTVNSEFTVVNSIIRLELRPFTPLRDGFTAVKLAVPVGD